MIEIGKINKLKVLRKKDYGYFLDGQTMGINDDILLPNQNIRHKNSINLNQEVEVFIYKDSQNRLVATQKSPKALAGQVAILEVRDNSEIGSFIDIGLERDVLVPFRERKYKIFEEEKYPFYIYVDKSGRLAATTDVGPYLNMESPLKKGDTCEGYVFGFQSNGTALVCIEPNYYGLIVKDEYYTSLREGDHLNGLRVIKKYEDGKLGLSTRAEKGQELDRLAKNIVSYMEGNDGYMRFNDKSDPEEIRLVFSTSKKNFKRSLGRLMKAGLIRQDNEGTWLL
ncbi:DNA-binding protein [Peptostreptococcus sp. MV1]|uniref:CvfB family protein n=1 Tax=Peptostreptococcus sp. MV1 TaxID=1219626 RepID=UPI000510384F|nr:S1-like domain-containing RNA-binding protein [Peptostreptococcus sp. MV1]KGF10584.1 DNA-binding protein [Peptostreptococcus sp. MV1]